MRTRPQTATREGAYGLDLDLIGRCLVVLGGVEREARAGEKRGDRDGLVAIERGNASVWPASLSRELIPHRPLG